MPREPVLHSTDAASWVLLAVLGASSAFAIRGLGFVIDGPHAVLPSLGLIALVGAVLFARFRRRAKLLAGATAFLQMTLFTVLAVTLAYALAARSGPLRDVELAAADALLGLQWPVILRDADALPPALWLGKIAYDSLTAQMIVCILALSATGRIDALRVAVTAAILSGVATIAISGLIPAMGNLFDPAAYHHLPPSIAWQERGLIAGLRDGSDRVLDFSRLMGIVSFPSYHSTLPVILAWALREVRFLRVAAPIWAAVTIMATPIFGGHYGVDVLGGLLLAILAIAIAPRLTARRGLQRLTDGQLRLPACAPFGSAEARTVRTPPAMSATGREAHHSLMLAAAIGGTWLFVHFGAIFFWRWSLATAPIAVGLIVLQAWLSTGLFIVAHDCMHGSLVPGRPRLNNAIGTLFLGAYAALSYAALLPKHHAHHAAPGTDSDPDFHLQAPTKMLPWFVSFFRNYYSHGQILRITAAALVYIAVGASLLNIVAFWAVPALLALAQLFVFGTFLPHRHDDLAFADHHNARNSALSPLTSLLTCFHFGAYHHEHHLNPGAPWWRLPSLKRTESAPR